MRGLDEDPHAVHPPLAVRSVVLGPVVPWDGMPRASSVTAAACAIGAVCRKVARMVAEAAPASARVVKAFNTIFRDVLAAGGPLDVFIAGDDAQAKARLSAFIESLGLRPMDTGPLTMARTLEHACLLSLGLLTHSVKHTNFSLGVSLLG